MNRPLISIVVATHNRASWLREALVTLVVQQTEGQFDYEIIVVDNASTDATHQVVQETAASSSTPVRYFHQATPGDAPTRNLGVEQSRGAWLAFFDDDQFAHPDWLCNLYDAARQTSASLVGGAVHLDLTPEEELRLGPICREALREAKFYDAIQPYIGKHLPGCGNALVSRSVFDSIGLFDTKLINGGSDSDFFLRAQAASYTLWYTPHAVIRHRVPAERLTTAYLRWDALQGGDNTACFDYQRHGAGKLALLATARAVQTLMVHLPLLLVGRLRKNAGQVLGRSNRLWRTEGYVRRTLCLLAPRFFSQDEFLQSLNFHNGLQQPNQ